MELTISILAFFVSFATFLFTVLVTYRGEQREKKQATLDALTQLILKTCGEQQKCSLETLAEAIKRNRVKHIKNVKFPTNMTKSEFCNLVQNSAKTKWIRNNKRFF